MDGGVAPAGRDRQLGALAHLDQRAVAEAEHGARGAGGADELGLADLRARREPDGGVGGDALETAADRLHGGAAARGHAEEGLVDGPRGPEGGQQDGRRHRVLSPAARRRGCGPARRTPGEERQVPLAGTQERSSAGHAIAKVVFDQERAGGGQLSTAMGGKKGHDVGAPGDRIRGGREAQARRGEPFPHARGRLLRRAGSGHIVAQRVDRVVQARFLGSGLVSHRRPLLHCPSSSCRRCRVRCRLTATDTREMPSRRAMSRLAWPSR